MCTKCGELEIEDRLIKPHEGRARESKEEEEEREPNAQKIYLCDNFMNQALQLREIRGEAT